MTAEDILGPNIGSLKGKTMRWKGEHVPTQRHDIPIEIIQKHREVLLCIDVMLMNKIPFLMTMCRDIKFGTPEMIYYKSRKCAVFPLYF